VTLKHRCLLTSGFTMLSVVVVLGSASAASQDRSHRIQVVQSQPLYNYHDYPVGPAVRPGCYLPSDGCLSEYSVQN
jgi:hypothetical protein